jgi:prophage antirepressor-like protein
VTALRSHHRIPVWRPAEDDIEPWLNLTRAAKLLGISQKTLRIAAESGQGHPPASRWTVDLQPL